MNEGSEHVLAERERHLWWSEKREKQRSPCGNEFAEVYYRLRSGEEIKTSVASSTMEHGCLYDDMVYLGIGVWSRGVK